MSGGLGSDGVFGFREPEDLSNHYNALRFVVRMMLLRVRTAHPVVVVACTNTGDPTAAIGTVDVQPLVSIIDGAGNTTPHDVIFGLPYLRLSGGNGAVVLDPVAGDIGLAVFADRDVSNVKDAMDVAAPGSYRVHDMADGFYVGSFLAQDPPQQFVALNGSGITLSDAFGNVVAMGQNGIAITGNVTVTGNLSASGTVIAGEGSGNQVGLQTHTHQQPPDSHGDAEQPTQPPTSGT